MTNTSANKNRLQIMQTIENWRSIFDRLPGIVIVNDIHDGSVLHMSERGLRELSTNMQALADMGPEYYSTYFNLEQANEYVPEMLAMLKRNNPEETFTFFQQVRYSKDGEWTWHLSSVRIFEHDAEGNPIAVITISQRINPEQHYTKKVERLLEDLNFIRSNVKAFSSLRKSEKNILKHLASGMTSSQIADELHISTKTVETHRKNIRKKLGVKSLVELSEYARAFDLI